MVATADVSGIAYFLPIISFLIVFVVIYAVLAKSKIIGESLFVQLFVSFLLSAIFISASAPRDYVQTIIPWFVVVLISLFLLLAMIGLIGKPAEFMNKGIGVVFIIVLVLILIGAAFFAFSSYINPYLPGATHSSGGNPAVLAFANWIYSSRVSGAILLIVISAIVSWVLVKTK